MAVDRSNPLALEVTGTVEIPNMDAQLGELFQRVQDLDDSNAPWIDKQAKLTKLRFGVRRPRTLPWKNSSNISVPVIDGIIRRWRPGIASLVLDANPTAFFEAQEGSDLETARKVERFFTWLFTINMKVAREVVRLVDILGSRGSAYAREGWDYQTQRKVRILPVDNVFKPDVSTWLENAKLVREQAGAEFDPVDSIASELEKQYGMSRQIDEEAATLIEAAQSILDGNEYIRLAFREILHDRPCWSAVDPVNVVVPQDQEAETADNVTVIHRMSRPKIRQMIADGWFDEDPAQILLDKLSKTQKDVAEQGQGGQAQNARDLIRQINDRRTGVNRTGRGTTKPEIEIYETFCHLDLGRGTEEKCVVWWCPEFKIILARYEYAMPFDEWPLTTFKFSHDSGRAVDNRGIPEMTASFAKLVNAFHNAWVDACSIQLSPTLKVKAAAGKIPEGIRVGPGVQLPVNHTDDIEPLVHDLRVLGELLRAENMNQQQAENYIGIFDASIRSGQRSERRTATEIGAIENMSADIFGLDSKLFQESMSRSFRKVWALWLEFGPPEVFFRVQGEENPVQITRKEVDKNWDIRAAGTPSNTSRAIMVANIERVLPLALNDATGLVDKGALLKEYFRLIDFPLAQQVVRNPEDAAAVQQVMQAAQAIGAADPNTPSF
jgi:hypothetical protein